MKRPDQIEPATPEAFARAVHDAAGPGARLIFASSSMTYGGNRRVGVFRWASPTPELVHDDFVQSDDEEATREAVASHTEVISGGWDVMYATNWHWVWAQSEGSVWLWERGRGLCVLVVDGELVLKGRAYPLDEVEQVEVWASPSRVTRKLLLRRGGAEPLVLVEDEDLIALLDPTYDYIMLDCETAWMQILARTLAELLARPYVEALP